jgi:hypothetical protein
MAKLLQMAQLGPQDGKLHRLRRLPRRSRDGDPSHRQISITIEGENESAQCPSRVSSPSDLY